MQLEQREFELIRELLYRKTGMAFDDRKRLFVQSRVLRRVAAIDCDSPLDYYRFLKYQDTDEVELQNLTESLTTNETYFFREYPQLECFANHVLPELCQQRIAEGRKQLSIWSAACSTGDEAYTLAIILKACLDDIASWRITVMATDIDQQVLSVAQQAVYTDRALKDVPTAYREHYFTRGVGRYRVKPEIKQFVKFGHLNLVDRRAMRAHRDFDAIFCRNALIYFDDASRRKVLSSFYDALRPGGYLFLGHSESVGRISAAFEMASAGGFITYRRPARTPDTQEALTETCHV